MEQSNLSANTVIAHPQALTDKITLIRNAGPSKFQVFPTLSPNLCPSFILKAYKFCVVWSLRIL